MWQPLQTTMCRNVGLSAMAGVAPIIGILLKKQLAPQMGFTCSLKGPIHWSGRKLSIEFWLKRCHTKMQVRRVSPQD